MTWQLLDAARSVLVHGGATATLALAPASLAQRCWPQGRPRPVDLEHAIDQVEDTIERAGLKHEERGTLWLDGSLAHLLLAWLPALPGSGCPRDRVEAVFTSCVAQVHAGQTDNASGQAVAALLMLRELMHHLGFQNVAVASRIDEGTP